MMKRSILLPVTTLVSLLLLVACGGKEVASIVLSQSSAEMEVGTTLSLTATVSPSNASYDGIAWTSSSPNVASVSETGQVTAFTEGVTTIIAMAGGKSATCAVKVKISVAGVTLDKTSLYLAEGVSDSLTATISPDDATDQSLIWTSSDPSVVTVSSDGVVLGQAAGTATITVKTNDGEKAATCDVTVIARTIPLPEIVDMGLSVKWASFNLGASKPEEIGDFYAWGDPEPYYSSLDPIVWKDGKEAGYVWASYKWCMGSSATLTKYNDEEKAGYNGFKDNKTTLDPEDDAAHMTLGGRWRMPTYDELKELYFQCTWTRATVNGVKGYLVTSSNGNSIFFPSQQMVNADGSPSNSTLGRYLTSTLSHGRYAWTLFFMDGVAELNSESRSFASFIRPIIEK